MRNLDALIESRRSDIIKDLEALVRIESVRGEAAPGAPFGAGIRKALDFMLNRGREMGFVVKDVQGYAGHLELGAGEELVGVLGHVDVVPPGEGWTRPPFAAGIVDGRLYGRGSTDDKGPIVACLHAMDVLHRSNLRPKRRLRLIIGCDEESGWECVEHYFAREERPLFGFAPDGEFPLINAEKGYLGLDLRGKCSGRQDGGSLAIRSLIGGSRRNIIADYCRAVLEGDASGLAAAAAVVNGKDSLLSATLDASGLTVEARGRAAHASIPQEGDSAIARMLRGLYPLLSMLPVAQAKALSFLHQGFGHDNNGTGLGIAFTDPLLGDLTSNLGKIEWTATGCEMQLDLRFPATMSRDVVYDGVRSGAAACGLDTAIFIELPAVNHSPDHPLVRKLLDVYRAKTGRCDPPLAIGGRTYACAIGTGVAFGPRFPGTPELAHVPDEYMDLNELMQCAKIYAAAMAALIED